MTPPTTARTRIEQWLKVYGEHSDEASLSHLATPLLVGDLKALVEAFDAPCGSCHPCVNYADQTWRDADRHPPTPREWDQLVATLGLVRRLADARHFVSVEALRKVLAGESS